MKKATKTKLMKCPDCKDIVCSTSVRKKNFYCETCNKVWSLSELSKGTAHA